MDLKKRLAQLDRLSRPGEPLNTQGNKISSATREAALVELELTRTETSAGPVWSRRYHDDLPCPVSPLPELKGFFSRSGDFLCEAGDLLFLDTETTGLVGGTGTIPFMVGVSWWEEDRLITRQYFLPDPGFEPAMLQDLAGLAARFRVVVTFNGASFDLPLLRTRTRLNRLPDPMAKLAVWDLLVPSRRLYGNRLPNCRQQTLEREIVGYPRGAGDIDGSRIPQTWFDFLATGQVGLLPRVMTHNRRDMVGMACLFGSVIAAARIVECEPCPTENMEWQYSWALGKICERRRQAASALACLDSAVAAAPTGAGEGLGDRRFLADALRILKRGQDWRQVEIVIRQGMAAGIDEPWLHREAAILYEHRLVDLAKALDHALKSGEDHRVRRLKARIR